MLAPVGGACRGDFDTAVTRARRGSDRSETFGPVDHLRRLALRFERASGPKVSSGSLTGTDRV
jgi:hypothetical protein